MNNTENFAESHSADPVLREMARIARFIASNPSLTKQERAQLIRRLETEYHAYKAWNKQYAGYFRTPKSDKPNTPQTNFGSQMKGKR